RRDDGGPQRFLASLSEAHTHGSSINWNRLLDAHATTTAQLPTYAFQHHHYWLTRRAGAQDASELGQASVEHPVLRASVPLAEGEVVFTGRLALDAHPWLTDHALMGRVLVPSTSFLELALHAAARLGEPIVDELTLAAPLVLDEQRPVQLQVRVSGPD